VKRRIPNWKQDFPIHDEAEDFAGRKRSFVVDCDEGPLGYTVRASEAGKEGLGLRTADHGSARIAARPRHLPATKGAHAFNRFSNARGVTMRTPSYSATDKR